jgi:hypothetical protein
VGLLGAFVDLAGFYGSSGLFGVRLSHFFWGSFNKAVHHIALVPRLAGADIKIILFRRVFPAISQAAVINSFFTRINITSTCLSLSRIVYGLAYMRK